MENLHHLALEADWRDALAAGAYRVSTIGRTVDEEGFIHCSFEHQVAATAARFYGGRDDVLLLTIDPARLAHEVRVENLDGGDELFPHLYGPLPLDAVIEVAPYPVS
jgi:glutathione S-transferase